MGKTRYLCALLAFALAVSGCSSAVPVKDSADSKKDADAKIEIIIDDIPAVETTAAEPEPFTFNPHIHSYLLSELVTDEMWDSLYNMCDAIRAGEDIFECTDQEAYEWCTDSTTIGTFLPAACTLVVGDGYENGTGRLSYKMDKDEFLAREQAFEDEVERILNEAVRSDYSEFEKVMGLYDYVCKNFYYDYTPIDGLGVDDFSNYACIMTKNGICCEIAYAYAYLLLQCGVEATPFGSSCYHDWTYVVVDGKGYHVDATWALYGDYEDGDLCLQYFMMTEEDRLGDGLIAKESLEADLLWPWTSDYDISRFSATDSTFELFHDGAIYTGMDTERNVVSYIGSDGLAHELGYGDM